MEGEDKPEIVWDSKFQTERVIEQRIPVIIILNTTENECEIIDVALPADCSMTAK